MQLPQYSRYESYKDSGIGWVGEVPEDWELLANKYIFRLSKSQVGKRSSEYTLLSLTLRGIIERDMENPEGKFPAEFDTYQEVNPGDFVFCHFDVEETPRTVGLSRFAGMITGAYTVYKTLDGVDRGFLEYFYLNADKDKKLRSLYKGLRNTIPKENFASFKTPLPTLQEQQAIARFLDDKTDKIDRAVKIKEGQIALLRERKQIIIQEAVTKGLNPDAPMKDSGIDWIGQIPAHWEVEKLFGLCRFVRGNSAFSKDELLDDGDYVALQYGKTYKVDAIDSSYGFYVNEEFYKRSQVVNFGDTIIISTSETIEDLGHSAVYNRDDAGLLGGEQILIKPISDLMDHLFTFYSTRAFLKELKRCATGVKVFRFNISDLKTIYTAVPPKDEQAEIASRIRSEMGKVDKAIELKERQIEALKEYKATLINAAVTGKIKVI